ncbi:MAG TPA: hypothetical protein VIH52_04010 [Candidatus Nanoarchaeia archaeon]|nr:hypothetical protein [uncultured archaeon]
MSLVGGLKESGSGLWVSSYPTRGQELVAFDDDGHDISCGQVICWEAICSYYFEAATPKPGFRVRTMERGDFDVRIASVQSYEDSDYDVITSFDEVLRLPEGSYGRCVYEPGPLLRIRRMLTHFSWPGIAIPVGF